MLVHKCVLITFNIQIFTVLGNNRVCQDSRGIWKRRCYGLDRHKKGYFCDTTTMRPPLLMTRICRQFVCRLRTQGRFIHGLIEPSLKWCCNPRSCVGQLSPQSVKAGIYLFGPTHRLRADLDDSLEPLQALSANIVIVWHLWLVSLAIIRDITP